LRWVSLRRAGAVELALAIEARQFRLSGVSSADGAAQLF
jgi:hypothetical protein